MTVLLEARNVSKAFRRRELFKGFDETIALENLSIVMKEKPPTITGVAGESGSGKSTLGRLLLGFIAPTEGEVLYKGRDIRKISRTERLEFITNIQAIFQDPFGSFNPFYKVDHALAVPISKLNLATSQKEKQKMIEETLEVIGLNPSETLGRYPHQMSGGQRQRVMIARALLLKPRIIIADEPVSMVDASLRATILETLSKLKQDFGISLLYISHDLTTIYQICDDILVLYRGTVVERGDVEQVIKNPKHPYTRLLVESIPHPDPDKKWTQSNTMVMDRRLTETNRGCKFVDNCPITIQDLCRDTSPPMFQTDRCRSVRCHHYKDARVSIAEETRN